MAWVMIDMKHENALIGTAMLSAIWEMQQRDTLDLISPLIKYAIGRTSSIGKVVDPEKVRAKLNDEFGVADIPIQVILGIFHRFEEQGILKEHKFKYVLVNDISADCESLNTKKKQSEGDIAEVIAALSDYLQANCNTFRRKKENVHQLLLTFLGAHGILAYAETQKLKNLKSDSEYNYWVSTFILEHYENRDSIFKSLTSYMEGFMLSRVIRFISSDEEKPQSLDLSSVDFYFDTTLMLRSLGYKSKPENENAQQLVKMLRERGAEVHCFPITKKEIMSSFKNYVEALVDPRKRKQTLESFDEQNFSIARVESEAAAITVTMQRKHITPPKFISMSSYVTDYEYKAFDDKVNLFHLFKTRIHSGNGVAAKNDVECICAVHKFRQGKTCKSISDCSAVFVTTNSALARCTDREMTKSGFDYEIPVALSDLDLVTLLWLSEDGKSINVPERKLVELAQSAMTISEDVKDAFYKKVNELIEEGSLEDDPKLVYANMQSIYLCKERFISKIEGNPANIAKLDAEDVKSLTLQAYAGVPYVNITKLEGEHQQKVERLTQTVQLLESEIQALAGTESPELIRAIQQIEKLEDQSYKGKLRRCNNAKKRAKRTAKIILYPLFGVVAAIAVIGTIYSFVTSEPLAIATFIFLSVTVLVAIAQIIDYFKNHKHFLQGIITWFGNRAYEKELKRIGNEALEEEFPVNVD